jgi:hypothetical protein
VTSIEDERQRAAEMDAFKLAEQVLRRMTEHRTKHFDQPPGEIHLSVADGQLLHNQSLRNRPDLTHHVVKDGDVGSLWGRPYRVSDDVKPGQAFIGYRVTL